MTHAMFMRGQPDPFRSLEGGSFAALDEHLAWVRANYPEIEFATASEAVAEFLDYYSPNLTGVVDSRLIGGHPEKGRFQFPIRLLGKGIHVDAEHPAELSLMAPSLFRPGEILEAMVYRGEEELARARGPEIGLVLDDRDEPLTFEVHVQDFAIARLAAVFSAPPIFHDVPEKREPDLLNLKRLHADTHSVDRLKLFAPEVNFGSSRLALVLLGLFLAEKARGGTTAVMEVEQPLSPDFDFRSSAASETRFIFASLGDTGRATASVVDPAPAVGIAARLHAALEAVFRMIRK
jgi:hypothetical protein